MAQLQNIIAELNLVVNDKNYDKIINDITLFWAIMMIQKIWRGYIVRKELKKISDKVSFSKVHERLNKYNKDLKWNEEFYKDLELQKYKKKERQENFPSFISENIAKFAEFKKSGIMPNWDTKVGDLEIDKNIPNWNLDTKTNTINPEFIKYRKKIEVKGGLLDCPSSFGSKEDWDILYFVDTSKCEEYKFKVYKINLSNNSEKWKNINIKGSEFDNENIPEIPNDDILNNLTKRELVNLCEKRGIKKTGNKSDLKKYIKNEQPGSKFKFKKYFEYVEDGLRPHASFYKIIKSQLEDECELIFDGHISQLDY